jgi:hypothetical protein
MCAVSNPRICSPPICASCCQSPVQRLDGLDHDAGKLADFLRHLRLIAEVGDQHDVALRDDEQRAGAGESREVPDIGKSGEQQSVQMRRGETVDERRHPTRAWVAHERAPFSVETRPRSASSYPRAPRTDHATDRRRREHGMPTFRLARVHVGDVDFDERHRHAHEGVAQREAAV